MIDRGISQTSVGISDSLYSNVLNEQRSLKILLPDEYKPGSSDKYEVIYLCDGEWNLETFSFIYNFAKGENFVPPVIFVAVRNTYIKGMNQRERDLLPLKSDDSNISGGADHFISFFKNELIPYIEKKYPCNGEKSLYGHSYGGTFVMYVLLTAPGMFDSYYCSDPAFHWNHYYLNKLASSTFEKTPELDKTLWINGIVETSKMMGSQEMDSILKMKAPKGLIWKCAFFPNETHNSVRLKGIYDGVKFTYSGYSNTPIEFHPMNGIVLKNTPTKIFFFKNYGEIHYTVDGTEPTLSSPKAGRTFEINGPANLTVKSFGNKKGNDLIGKGNFEEGSYFPAMAKLKNAQKGGLKYSYYEGIWDSLPDFKKLTPVKTGIADSTFVVGKIKNPVNFACLLEGYIQIENDGPYAFGLMSDDGAKFYLNGKLLINNDGLHAVKVKSYVVPLKKGYYPLRIEYFQRDGASVLGCLYLKPGTDVPKGIPFNLQYHTK